MELIARGAKIDQTEKSGRMALHYAAYNKSPEVIKLLVARGSNVNWQDVWGQSSLMIAAQNAHSVDNVKVLLALGADKNLRNEKGKTAMDLVNEDLKQSGIVYFEKESKEIKKLLSQ